MSGRRVIDGVQGASGAPQHFPLTPPPPAALAGELFRTFKAFQSGRDSSHSKKPVVEGGMISMSVQ